jgi:hypothetical protein
MDLLSEHKYSKTDSTTISRPLGDLDQRLATEKKLSRGREVSRQHLLEMRVRGVAYREPEDLRRRAELLQQEDEIAVFGHHHRTRLSGGEEDLPVFGLAQSKLANRLHLDLELRREPPSKIGRELRVYPKI